MSRRGLIDVARNYVGTPFHHAARTKGTGVDCMGLLVCAGKEINYPFTDILTYSRTATDFGLVEKCADYLDEIAIGDQQPGDVGLFWIDPSTKLPQHTCIFSDYRDGIGMIHAWEQAGRTDTPRRRRGIGVSTDLGSVVEHHFSRFWESRLCRVFSMRGVEPWRP